MLFIGVTGTLEESGLSFVGVEKSMLSLSIELIEELLRELRVE